MFKDLYKNANDKIPTEEAYLRVMEQVNAKKQKTKYSYAKIVALAACFLLTVSMISVYENFAPKEEVPFSVVTPENLPANTPEAKTTPVVQPRVAMIEETSQPVIEAEPIEDLETTEPVLEVTETPVPENSFVKNQGIPEDIGTNSARFTLGDTVLKETYYEYLGKNIEEALVLPDGFINETPDTHILCLEQNENFDDRWTFYFTQGENSIFITTTKNTATILNLLNSESYEKSNISGINAVIFEEDLQKIACIEVGGIAYTLSSYGVSDEDFENLIKSLII
ncbi:MAG: hypothetical protein IJ300_05755 [Clostridia bacterium]|nr:hypothetical protein [Clostridia bacterium]